MSLHYWIAYIHYLGLNYCWNVVAIHYFFIVGVFPKMFSHNLAVCMGKVQLRQFQDRTDQNKTRYWPAYPTNFPKSVCACQLGALHLTFSKATGLWTAKETGVYIGENMGLQGKQRAAVWLRFLHQEERLSRCVARMYHVCMNVLLLFLSFPPVSFRQPAINRSPHGTRLIVLLKGSFC